MGAHMKNDLDTSTKTVNFPEISNLKSVTVILNLFLLSVIGYRLPR